MNKLTIIGNLTRDAELRATSTGKDVCSFTVAVGKRVPRDQQPEADFFRVSIWNERARSLSPFLCKGKKVCVIGAVSVRTYTANDGETRAYMEIKSADEIELLSYGEQQEQRQENSQPKQEEETIDRETGYQEVYTDELPF